jgi:hypothetical protein
MRIGVNLEITFHSMPSDLERSYIEPTQKDKQVIYVMIQFFIIVASLYLAIGKALHVVHCW